jgi:hypothetical protein
MRAVEKYALTLRRMTREEWLGRWQIRALKQTGVEIDDRLGQFVWVFEADVEDKAVPLSDSLVLNLYRSNGAFLIRFAAKL